MENDSKEKLMKILITGASGLIGVELCRQLVEQNKNVIAVDNFSRSEKIPLCSKFYSKDLTLSLDFLKEEADNIEVIYHLAAVNGTSNFYSKPNYVLSNNTKVDLNVFEFAKTCKNLKKIFYASSSELKGHENFCTESNQVIIDDISNPRYSYRIAKIASENYLHNSELPWVILRYFNVYGPESKSGHFVYDQIDKHRKKIFKVIGADETRCYTYVNDAVDATIQISDCCPLKITINIGSNEELSSIDATKIIARELGYVSECYEIFSSLSGSPKQRRPDISTLVRYYPNYSPINFKTGIRKIINYEKSK
jgi:nucleoside-diphosphate-sugar epimerase